MHRLYLFSMALGDVLEMIVLTLLTLLQDTLALFCFPVLTSCFHFKVISGPILLGRDAHSHTPCPRKSSVRFQTTMFFSHALEELPGNICKITSAFFP